MPSLRAYLARPLPLHQPMVAVVDVLSERDLRLRLMGSGLIALVGKDLTSTNALDVYPADLRPRIGHDC